MFNYLFFLKKKNQSFTFYLNFEKYNFLNKNLKIYMFLFNYHETDNESFN